MRYGFPDGGMLRLTFSNAVEIEFFLPAVPAERSRKRPLSLTLSGNGCIARMRRRCLASAHRFVAALEWPFILAFTEVPFWRSLKFVASSHWQPPWPSRRPIASYPAAGSRSSTRAMVDKLIFLPVKELLK
jgi:hypothetical protein